MLKIPHLIISIQLITENIEYALKNAGRPKPIAVCKINRGRQKYSLATSVLGDSFGPPAEKHAKWKT